LRLVLVERTKCANHDAAPLLFRTGVIGLRDRGNDPDRRRAWIEIGRQDEPAISGDAPDGEDCHRQVPERVTQACNGV
jgi:hypothetical protein